MRVRTVAFALAGAAALAMAHHSFDAEYDSSKKVTITGSVTKVDWVNPHAYVFLNVETKDAGVMNYRAELGPPYALVRGGWKRDTVKVGDTITVEAGAPAKDGSPHLGATRETSLILANGQKMVMR